MQRTLIAVALVAGLLSVVTVRAQESVSYNGTFWLALSRQQKYAYVAGYTAGRIDESFDLMGVCASTKDAMNTYVKATASLYRQGDAATPGVNEIAAAVDAFYRDAKNLPICENHAVYAQWRSLTGHPLSDAIEIDSWRTTDGKNGCQ